MKSLATALLSLVLHLTLGWGWTLGAGVVGGFWAGRGGWRTGALGVGLAWLLLIFYNYAVAEPATVAMTQAVGGLGNLPGIGVVAITLLIGLLLGALGGGLGTQLAGCWRRTRWQRRPARRRHIEQS